MPVIKEIDFKNTYIVRHPVLRKGLELSSCYFEGDELPTTKHFGLFINNDLIGVVSVFKSSNAFFMSNNQFQIRGMAVLDSHQKKGYGNLLINKAEGYVKKTNKPLLWFNARESAIEFYKKMGYAVYGEGFILKDIGKHFAMYRILN